MNEKMREIKEKYDMIDKDILLGRLKSAEDRLFNEKVKFIDQAAIAALTGLLANPEMKGNGESTCGAAFGWAEKLWAERKRRMK